MTNRRAILTTTIAMHIVIFIGCHVASLRPVGTYYKEQTKTLEHSAIVKGHIVYKDGSEPSIGTEVLLVSIANGNAYRTATDIDGNFLIKNLPAGSYRAYLQLSCQKFRVESSDIIITEGDVLILNIQYPEYLCPPQYVLSR
jgi:hypothetical protein